MYDFFMREREFVRSVLPGFDFYISFDEGSIGQSVMCTSRRSGRWVN